MSRMVIGLLGLIGSGKGTAGDILVSGHGFTAVSFASKLKDMTAVLFGWPRHLLEGDTAESREWREQVDSWWAKRLGIEMLTPRMVLQQMGTEVMRHGLHDDIWIYALGREIDSNPDTNYVITDVRFPNEIEYVNALGGHCVQIYRPSTTPSWYHVQAQYNTDLFLGKSPLLTVEETNIYNDTKKNVHVSETAWIAHPGIADIIMNDGGLLALEEHVSALVRGHQKS